MDLYRMPVCRFLCWKLFMAVGLLALTGCQLTHDATGTASSPGEQVATFISDFVHQALAAFLL